ncbi:hypothetical protein B0H13DRAFT_2271684 [Mycena leptocephala]|nr:hypothetical protein B0H13DRAFT_2271684 [Mycena leptocephala]
MSKTLETCGKEATWRWFIEGHRERYSCGWALRIGFRGLDVGEGRLEESLTEDSGSSVDAGFGVLGEPGGGVNGTTRLGYDPVNIVRGERSGQAGGDGGGRKER